MTNTPMRQPPTFQDAYTHTGSKWDLYQEAYGHCGGTLWPRYYSEHSDPMLEERPSLNLKEEEKGALFLCHPPYSSPFHSFLFSLPLSPSVETDESVRCP